MRHHKRTKNKGFDVLEVLYVQVLKLQQSDLESNNAKIHKEYTDYALMSSPSDSRPTTRPTRTAKQSAISRSTSRAGRKADLDSVQIKVKHIEWHEWL